jgi:hypothetical protein
MDLIRKVPTEHQEQVAFIQWFRYTYPKVKIMAIPNGACTNAVAGRRFKKEGRDPGVPDLYIPEWHLWIEMKRSNWKLAKNIKEGTTAYNQKDWQTYLSEKCNDSVFVAVGFEQAKNKVIEFLKNRG